jgi:hypothetical protein
MLKLMVSSPFVEELKHPEEEEDRLMQCVARRHLHGLRRFVGAATVDKLLVSSLSAHRTYGVYRSVVGERFLALFAAKSRLATYGRTTNQDAF